MIEINLTPGSGRKAKKGRPSAAASSSSSSSSSSSFSFNLGIGDALRGLIRNVTDPLLLGAIGSVGGVALLVGSMHTAQQAREWQLTNRVEEAVKDSTRYADVLKARAKAEAARDTVLRQLNIVKAIDGERFVWPHVLDEVSQALPAYTWVTGLSFYGTPQGNAVSQAATAVPAEGAKPDTVMPRDDVRVRVGGQTVDIQALTRFMRMLEQSPFLERVNLERSELVLFEGKEVTQFTLEMTYSRPDSTVVRRVPLTVTSR